MFISTVIHHSTHIRSGEVAKRLGTKWKSMTEEEKEVRPVPCVLGSVLKPSSHTSKSTRQTRSVRKRRKRPTRYANSYNSKRR
jgi:hypothetical protein